MATVGPSLCPTCHYGFPCDYSIQPSDRHEVLTGYESITILILPFSGVNTSRDNTDRNFRAFSGGKCPFEDCFLNAKEFALLIKPKQKSLHNDVTTSSAAVPSNPSMASVQLKCNHIKGILELYDNDCTQH